MPKTLPPLPSDWTQDSDLSRPTAKKAWKILDDYLEGKVAGGDKVKVAAGIVNSHSKNLAAESNRAGIRMMMAKLTIKEIDVDSEDGGGETGNKVKFLR